jgi:hypothetical protein
MSTVVVGHQPQFMPYIGILNKISKADIYIIVDHVQFVKKYFHNRTFIKVNDAPLLLTVPVLTKGDSFAPINRVKINHTDPWIGKHLKTLRLAYQKAPFFENYYGRIEEIFMKRHELLSDFTSELLIFFLREFELVDDIRISSGMGITGARTELLIDLTRAVAGDTYISGAGARDYFDDAVFSPSGFKHMFNEFTHPVYPQLGRKFVKDMGCIDLLFNCGKSGRKYILKPEEFLA